MKKIEINRFQDFVDYSYLKEGIQTDQEAWERNFNDIADKSKKASSAPVSASGVSGLPDWAKEDFEKNDKLKGKSADERWTWLTNRINTAIKDKQASKVESLKGSKEVDIPGYRILWKEDKTETQNAEDSLGREIKIFYTDIFKGNPGTFTDRKDNNGKPGEELATGYWGQKSTVEKVPGSTTTPTEADLGILWVEPKEDDDKSKKPADLLDLFASTPMGREVMSWLYGDKAYQDFKKTGKITTTDSPPTSTEVKNNLTAQQKADQEKNAQRMQEAGQKVLEPDYKEITSGEYTYNPDSFKITWDQVFEALKGAKIEDKMDFRKVNIVGIRNTTYTKNKFSNRFTDLIVVMGPKKDKSIKIYPATTTPGPAFMYAPFRNWWTSIGLKETLNPKGTAILQPGVYEYRVGKYKDKYDALLQSGDVKIGRLLTVLTLKDLTFKTFSPTPIEQVSSGIDIIKAETNTPSIDSFSAGSQVLKKSSDFNEMMEAIKDSNQSTVKYALINSSDLDSK